MAENPFTSTAAPAPAALDYAAIAKSDPQIISGAHWFWWIVGLSLINTIVAHSGGSMSFVMGLGFTLIADAAFQEFKVIAFAIDVLFLGFFFGMGWFARQGHVWAFIAGIVVYVLDSAIYLYFQDWLPFGFHALALFYIVRATGRLRSAIKATREAPVAAPPPLAS